MDFGVGIATSGDSWKLAQRAEELGFTHAWFYDTQMLTGDCFVAMGAAALKTSKIRLGTGVLVPSNRIAAVTANHPGPRGRAGRLGADQAGVRVGFTIGDTEARSSPSVR
jgi:5,10-methylenetetrahydromethanopterin reductase